jgi:hypothetical protein
MAPELTKPLEPQDINDPDAEAHDCSYRTRRISEGPTKTLISTEGSPGEQVKGASTGLPRMAGSPMRHQRSRVREAPAVAIT